MGQVVELPGGTSRSGVGGVNSLLLQDRWGVWRVYRGAGE